MRRDTSKASLDQRGLQEPRSWVTIRRPVPHEVLSSQQCDRPSLRSRPATPEAEEWAVPGRTPSQEAHAGSAEAPRLPSSFPPRYLEVAEQHDRPGAARSSQTSPAP